MSEDTICPQCQGPTSLYDKGTCTPRQFFSTTSGYQIAAGQIRERLPIYVCRVCGHGFTPLGVEPSQISRWYHATAPDFTFVAQEKARRRTARAILHWAEGYTPAKGRLLDIGAGPGIFVSEAARRGWSAMGLEPSTWAVRYGQEHFGIEMKLGETAALQEVPPNSCDVVTLFDVIEHVADPRALIEAAAAIVRPGGLLVLTTPRFDSLLARIMGRRWYCIFPAHIQYFTQRSLFALLQSAGFSILLHRTHTRYLSGHYIWQRLVAWLTGKSGTPAVSTHPLILPVNFGDEFEVYARKQPG